MTLDDRDLSTVRKVLAHFLMCKDVKGKYADAFQAEARELSRRLDAEAERREHMARRGT